MHSFLRTLEISGLGSFDRLLENMDRERAVQVFSFHGVNNAGGLNAESLEAASRSIIRENHEFLAGEEIDREVQAACEALNQGQELDETVLMEISSRMPTTVVYRFGQEGGWRPLGVLNRGEDLNDFLRREAGFILSSLQQAALDGGEVVMGIAIRTFDAILPSPGW